MAAYGSYNLSQGMNTVVNGYLKGYASVLKMQYLGGIMGYAPASAIINLSNMKVIAKGQIFSASQIINKCNSAY
jgi:hypothetical protein